MNVGQLFTIPMLYCAEDSDSASGGNGPDVTPSYDTSYTFGVSYLQEHFS